MVLKKLFTRQQWRKKHREQTHGHGERGGEGEMDGKSNMEAYITICKTDGLREFSGWLRKLTQGPLYQPRGVGWGGRWEGGSKGRRYLYTCGWFMLRSDRKQQKQKTKTTNNKQQKTTKFCKGIILQRKNKLKNKKNEWGQLMMILEEVTERDL